MFIIRFGVIVVFLVMLLPRGPEGQYDASGRDLRNAGFCERYPKTCDASGELFTAFKQKLSYGIVLARHFLEARSVAEIGPASSLPNVSERPFDQAGRDYGNSYASGTLRPDERSSELRPRSY
ncbi:MAG: hypothetical protein KKB37_03385 [Alphaproteobacteria bacterium]|nr:hypothetical protein [Alphaproteobacteria bacterium]